MLYAYMVSAVSAQACSARPSDQIAVFGVPQRMVPGQPRLRLRRQPLGATGIQVIGLPVAERRRPGGLPRPVACATPRSPRRPG